jgi:DNA repair exonuclease SbcCD ATPase subunit
MSDRRFVAISDVHAHPWAAFARGDAAQNTRLSRTLEVLHASLIKAEAEECPWIFGGDLVHTAGYTINTVLAELTALLELFPTVVKLAVWGNHDARGVGGRIILPQTIWATLARAVPELTVLTPRTGSVTANGLRFTGAGAQPANLFEYAESSDVGLYHGTVMGSVGPNGFVFDHGIDPRELYSRHRISVVGDIHHPQQMESIEGRVILIPGSPEHHNFGDAGEHGWWIVDVPKDDKAQAEFVRGESPKFLKVASPAEVQADGNYYRVLSTPVGIELPENATAVAPGPTVVEAREGWQGGAGQTELALQAWLKEVVPEGEAEDYLTVGRRLLAGHIPSNLSNLTLTQVWIENFCSYEQQRFPIQRGTWLVMGHGRDYPSNGAGKSSLFEAIYWLLFGRTTKGLSGDDVVRWGADDCVVTGTLQNPDGLEISITRRKVRGESATLNIEDEMEGRWEATSVTEMTEKLSQALGLTPELYQALGYFSQERLLLFASATDGARKDMLADLVGLSAYQEASSAAATALGKLEGERANLDGRQEAVNAQLWREQRRLDQLNDLVKSWDHEHQSRLARAEKELEVYDRDRRERRLHLIQKHRDKLGTTLTQRITQREQELQKIEQEIESVISGLDGDISKFPLADAQRFVEERQEYLFRLQTESATLTANLRNAREQRDKTLHRTAIYKGQLEASGQCPMCLQIVSPEQQDKCLSPWLAEVEIGNAAIAELEQRLIPLTNQIEPARQAVKEAKDDLQNVEWYLGVERRVAAVKTALSLLQDEQQALDSAATALADKDIVVERGMIISALEAAQNESNPHAAGQQSAQESIEANAQQMLEIDQRRAAILQEQAIYDYWRHGFSKQGLQSLLLDDVAARFNATRGEIIPALTQGIYDVQFSTISKTKAGELRERTEFLITERGESVPYEALSGGQRRRIDVGVMLTLIMAVSRWMRAEGALGLLVLDEVFDFLDAAGAEGLTEALRAVEEVVPAIYVIAHDPQLQALFQKVILVEQDAQGISRIVEADGGDERQREAPDHGEGNDPDLGRPQAGGGNDGTDRTVRDPSPVPVRRSKRAGVDGDPRPDGQVGVARRKS